ncbi:hypothetical protein C3L33_08852, partial [Rhododendron williamsianum]
MNGSLDGKPKHQHPNWVLYDMATGEGVSLHDVSGVVLSEVMILLLLLQIIHRSHHIFNCEMFMFNLQYSVCFMQSKSAKRRLRLPGIVPLAYAKVMKKLNFCG